MGTILDLVISVFNTKKDNESIRTDRQIYISTTRSVVPLFYLSLKKKFLPSVCDVFLRTDENQSCWMRPHVTMRRALIRFLEL